MVTILFEYLQLFHKLFLFLFRMKDSIDARTGVAMEDVAELKLEITAVFIAALQQDR